MFSWFIKLGLHFGDICIGVAAYVILQMIALSLVFAGCLYYIRTCGVTTKRMIGALLILMLLPIFPMYAICMLKDTVYATFCLIFIMMMHYVARTKGQAFRKVWFDLAMFAVACMMVLTKVYAMYILLIVGVVYLVKYRRTFAQIIASVILPVILYKVVFCGILLPALNVAPGGIQEALSVPFQQTAQLCHGIRRPGDSGQKRKPSIRCSLTKNWQRSTTRNFRIRSRNITIRKRQSRILRIILRSGGRCS